MIREGYREELTSGLHFLGYEKHRDAIQVFYDVHRARNEKSRETQWPDHLVVIKMQLREVLSGKELIQSHKVHLPPIVISNSPLLRFVEEPLLLDANVVYQILFPYIYYI